jgi:hypothetical protein
MMANYRHAGPWSVTLAAVPVELSGFFALIGLWTWKEQSDYESTAVPYLRSVVPKIATWDRDIAWNYFDDEVKDTISREEHAKIIRYLSLLGA